MKDMMIDNIFFILALIIICIFMVCLTIIASQDGRYDAMCEALGYESSVVEGGRFSNDNNNVYCLDRIETLLFEMIEATR